MVALPLSARPLPALQGLELASRLLKVAINRRRFLQTSLALDLMRSDKYVPIIKRFAIWAFLAIFLFALLYTALNRASGPVETTHGVVISTGAVPSDTGPSIKYAKIQLVTNDVVLAKVAKGHNVAPGDTTQVLVYRHIISGAMSYKASRIE